MGAFGPTDMFSFDHKSGSPESQSGLLPDINKSPPGQRFESARGLTHSDASRVNSSATLTSCMPSVGRV
jgi:hypothetical protein